MRKKMPKTKEECFTLLDKELSEEDKKYSLKVKTPVYVPSGRQVSIYELYDPQKYKRLVRRIEQSNVSEQEKSFLIAAASRHIVFNYERIADYYASASKEMQDLMEQSALVIIDFDKAIEQGFVQLNDKMRTLYENEIGEKKA